MTASRMEEVGEERQREEEEGGRGEAECRTVGGLLLLDGATQRSENERQSDGIQIPSAATCCLMRRPRQHQELRQYIGSSWILFHYCRVIAVLLDSQLVLTKHPESVQFKTETRLSENISLASSRVG